MGWRPSLYILWGEAIAILGEAIAILGWRPSLLGGGHRYQGKAIATRGRPSVLGGGHEAIVTKGCHRYLLFFLVGRRPSLGWRMFFMSYWSAAEEPKFRL